MRKKYEPRSKCIVCGKPISNNGRTAMSGKRLFDSEGCAASFGRLCARVGARPMSGPLRGKAVRINLRIFHEPEPEEEIDYEAYHA